MGLASVGGPGVLSQLTVSGYNQRNLETYKVIALRLRNVYGRTDEAGRFFIPCSSGPQRIRVEGKRTQHAQRSHLMLKSSLEVCFVEGRPNSFLGSPVKKAKGRLITGGWSNEEIGRGSLERSSIPDHGSGFWEGSGPQTSSWSRFPREGPLSLGRGTRIYRHGPSRWLSRKSLPFRNRRPEVGLSQRCSTGVAFASVSSDRSVSVPARRASINRLPRSQLDRRKAKEALPVIMKGDDGEQTPILDIVDTPPSKPDVVKKRKKAAERTEFAKSVIAAGVKENGNDSTRKEERKGEERRLLGGKAEAVASLGPRGAWEKRAMKLVQEKMRRELQQAKEAGEARAQEGERPVVVHAPPVKPLRRVSRSLNDVELDMKLGAGLSALDAPGGKRHLFGKKFPGQRMLSRPTKRKRRRTCSAAKQAEADERNAKLRAGLPIDGRKLLEVLGEEHRNWALVALLVSVGFSEADLLRLAFKRAETFDISVACAQARIDYLLSLGVKACDLSRLLLRHPRLLEYSVERTMQSRVDYLRSLGVQPASMGRLVTLSPSLLEHSIERGLKPRVRFLQEVVGVQAVDLPLVLQRSPQVLTQSIEKALQPRLQYLQSLGISMEGVARMVTRHPQLLHYSVEGTMRPHVEFLRQVGMSSTEISYAIVRTSQILSLSVERNLRPKVEFLRQVLGGDAATIARYPAFLSLSLEKRIKPRHAFLKLRNRLPPGPFPMAYLSKTDEDFCRHTKTDLADYHAFRHEMVPSGGFSSEAKSGSARKARATPAAVVATGAPAAGMDGFSWEGPWADAAPLANGFLTAQSLERVASSKEFAATGRPNLAKKNAPHPELIDDVPVIVRLPQIARTRQLELKGSWGGFRLAGKL
eukprot:TRINITY_DN20406_c0_g1_i1.p1 TRINITY_DN20406_c0_g1~~TRINITY_DN20406_c0_g1_i1.p1  ORF type:complete len:869 (-),score=154.16 TRINITY_DN20406_c0_g1_i1:166-2772(-)